MFSAHSPPRPLKALQIGPTHHPLPREPGYLTPIRKTTAVSFKPSIPPVPTSSPPTSRRLGHGSSIRFRFAEAQGAALVTKYETYREDVHLAKSKKYAKENHASWVEFARNAGYDDVNPVLITGVDRTRDFATMCYSDYDDGLECQFKTSDSGAWGTWETSRPIHQNHGPKLRLPPSPGTAGLLSSSGDGGAETAPDEYNQCVFIRYISMRSRRLWLPKMKAAAGPHNLSMGGQDGEESPLQAQYDSDPDSDTSSHLLDSDWDNGTGSMTSFESESDIVVHDPNVVRYL